MTLVDFTPSRDTVIQLVGTPRLLGWFAEHQVDGATVPLDSTVHLDPEVNEWRFEQFVPVLINGQRTFHLDPETGEPQRRVIRRAVKSMPPWVTEG